MQALHDFIIQQKEAFSQTFVTESGIELHADKRFSQDRLSNRVVKCLNIPLLVDSIIQPGYELMIDPTIYYTQNYEKYGRQDNTFIQDHKEGIYKISPGMIVLYRETPESQWKGFEENLLIEKTFNKQDQLPKSALFLPEFKANEVVDGIATIKYGNSSLEELGAYSGNKIAYNSYLGVSFFIDGKEFFWIRNMDVYGVINEN